MEKEHTTIGLDNPVFAGRLRAYEDEPEEVVPAHRAAPTLVVTAPVSEIPKAKAVQQPKVETETVAEVNVATASVQKQPLQFYFDDIDNSKPQKRKVHFLNRRKYKYISNSLVFLALILLSFGIYVAVSGMRLTKNIQNGYVNAQAVNKQEETPSPDEKQPTPEDISKYVVAPDKPRFIKIDKFGLKGRIKPVGVNKKGQLAAPDNVHDAGWYTDSAKPNTVGGTSVFDGHVSGTTQHGVFYDLNKVVNGDIITVERGDGTNLQYKVLAKEVLDADKVDMAKVLVSKNQAKPGLNLITCAGDVRGNSYSQRLVVYTELVK